MKTCKISIGGKSPTKVYAVSLYYLLSIHILALVFFSAFRLMLFLSADYTFPPDIAGDYALYSIAFIRGLWFDNVIACYILLLPLAAFWIAAWFGCTARWLYRSSAWYFTILYALCFVISAANIPYFNYFFKPINSSIFNWFDYMGTTAGMVFGESSYYLPMALAIATIVAFAYIIYKLSTLTYGRVTTTIGTWSLKGAGITFVVGALLVGLCVFGIRGRRGYNPIKVSQAYSSGIHTNHGMYSALYSFPAIMKRNAMKGSVIPVYSGLPTVLKQNGYSTMFFMTHESQYDNMNAFFRTNGFDEIYSQENYPADKVVNGFGVQDDYLFQYALPVLNRHAADGRPFFSVLLTISNHPPYIIPPYFHPHSKKKEEQIVEYADWSIKNFMTEALKQPWADNTIFVLMADHGKLVGTPECESPLSYNHIPLMIFGKDIEPRIIDNVGGQVDLMPTLLGILNIGYTHNGFGIDMLKEKRPYMFFTADNLIGVRDTSRLYIYIPDTRQELRYNVKKDGKVAPAEDNETFKAMKNYGFSMLQCAETLVKRQQTVDHPRKKQK